MIRWQDVNAIYQIYPRSFQDSNADGVGDLAGITSRLKYLKGEPDSLGVDAIWISPIFTSPMADFGYDVSDFKSVDPLFGSLVDFDELIAEAHRRDILVMLDFVPNHSSDQHRWFKEALKSKDSPYRQYYHFRDPMPDGSPPNNWLSVFGGSAWKLDELSNQYYLHSFLPEQPDLNWENPRLRDEMCAILRFWLERGVDGFRFDAVRWIAKDMSYRDDPANPKFIPNDDPYNQLLHRYSRYGAQLDERLHALSSVVREYDNTTVIFEDYIDRTMPLDDQVERLYAIDPGFAAPMNLIATEPGWSPKDFAHTISLYESAKPAGSRMIMCLGNHDRSRVVSRYGEAEARLLALLQLSLPGTPVVYYGEELGMEDVIIDASAVQDPFEKRVPGKGLGRDPERTPIAWDESEFGGFSTAKPWLPVGGNVQRSVANETNNPESFLQFYTKLLAIRRSNSALREGTYEAILSGEDMYWYEISHGDQTFAVIANFAQREEAALVRNISEIIVCSGEVVQKDDVICLAPLSGVLLRLIN